MTDTAELKKAAQAAQAQAETTAQAAQAAEKEAAQAQAAQAEKPSDKADKKAAQAAQAAQEAQAAAAQAAQLSVTLNWLLTAMETAQAAQLAQAESDQAAQMAAQAAQAAQVAQAARADSIKALAGSVYDNGGLFEAFQDMNHAKLADGLIGKLAVANASASVKRQPSSSKTGFVTDPTAMRGDRGLLHSMLVASTPVADWNKTKLDFDNQKVGDSSFEQSLSMMSRIWKKSGFGCIKSDKLGSVIRITIN